MRPMGLSHVLPIPGLLSTESTHMFPLGWVTTQVTTVATLVNLPCMYRLVISQVKAPIEGFSTGTAMVKLLPVMGSHVCHQMEFPA